MRTRLFAFLLVDAFPFRETLDTGDSETVMRCASETKTTWYSGNDNAALLRNDNHSTIRNGKRRPLMNQRILDLFCGAGGAAVGYYRAGFDIVGVDIVEQPFYPFEFIQADALSLDYEFLMSFDAIHASPPCQRYSTASALARRRGVEYPDLYIPVRRMLIASGLPYIIENVPGSPARGIGLCGSMFGLKVKRHRIFESNVTLHLPETPCTCYGKTGQFITVAGSMFAKEEGAAAMGIDWPVDKFQLKEAIPPAYTEFLGKQLRNANDKLVISVSERPLLPVSEAQPVPVSELPGITVSERPVLGVSGNGNNPDLINERRAVPVTRRCASCQKPLPQGTSRRKYCDSLCRLRAFRQKGGASDGLVTTNQAG